MVFICSVLLVVLLLFISKVDGRSSSPSNQGEEHRQTNRKDSSSTQEWYPIYKETFLFFLAISGAMYGLYICLSMTFCHEHFYFMPLPENTA
jgi:hypothetical protein